MAQINPVAAPFTAPEMLQAYANWLGGTVGLGAQMFNPYMQDAQNANELRVKQNPNQIASQMAWNPAGDMGIQALSAKLQNGGGGVHPFIQTAANNIRDYGGMGGYPTDLMHLMAQYGGSGKTGLPAMQNAVQYGGFSQASDPMKLMAQYGVASEGSGRQLANRAYGAASPATSYLGRFVNGFSSPYRAPAIQPRSLFPGR